MHSLLFIPKAAGTHETSAEARVLSLALQLHGSVCQVNELLHNGMPRDQVSNWVASRLMKVVHDIYPAGPDGGYVDILLLAEHFDLIPSITSETPQ